jgi:MFS family permease
MPDTEASGALPAPAEELEDLKRGRNALAVAVVVGHAIKHIFNSALHTLLLPEAKIGLGLSGAQFGSLLTARQITSWGTTIGAGYLGDRFSHRAPLLLGLSLSLVGVSFFIVGRAPNYWAMFGALLLAGMGPSLYHPPALGELSRRFPDKRGFAISLHGTGGSAGEVLGPMVAAGMLMLMTWRGVLQLSVFPAVMAGVLIWGMMRSLPGKKGPETASSRAYLSEIMVLIKNPVILFLVLVAAVRSAGDAAVGGFLPVYLREDLAFTPTRVAVYLALSQAAGVVTQPIMGHLSDTWGRKAVMLPGVAAVALLSLALSVAGTGAALTAIVVAKGAFSFPLHHLFIASAIDAAKGHVQSTVVALIYGAGFLGTFSPYIAGLLVDKFGIHSAFLYGGAVSVLAVVLLIPLRLPRTAQQLEEASITR